MSEPATPRPAATVILLRDATDGLPGVEVWLVKRARSLGFMGAAWVFPGGRVDPEDDALPVVGGRFEHVPRPFWAAAARELEEEAGVRLGPTGGPYELDRMRVWSHWVTPPVESRRYDTWFFVAALPEGQEARFDGQEAVEGAWYRPSAAVAAALAHELGLAPPTLRTLAELAAFDAVSAVLSVPRRTPEISPRFTQDDAGVWVLLPGDPEFPSDDPADPPHRFLFPLAGWQAR